MTAAFADLRRFKPAGVLVVPLGLFSCLRTALRTSEEPAGAKVRISLALDAGTGRPAGGSSSLGQGYRLGSGCGSCSTFGFKKWNVKFPVFIVEYEQLAKILFHFHFESGT